MDLLGISKSTVRRLPVYYKYLLSFGEDEASNISSKMIAEALGLNEVQVRKDLACVASSGKPRVGYKLSELRRELKSALSYDKTRDAIIIGAGKLGQALMEYTGFSGYGLNIVSAFDVNDAVVASNGLVRHVSGLSEFCRAKNIRIGIITVPDSHAQEAADLLVSAGIKAIWNFAPAHITVPEGVLVQNENMAASLAILSAHLG